MLFVPSNILLFDLKTEEADANVFVSQAGFYDTTRSKMIALRLMQVITARAGSVPGLYTKLSVPSYHLQIPPSKTLSCIVGNSSVHQCSTVPGTERISRQAI